MKVKHLIRKLRTLDPEANVYVGDLYDTIPAKYLLLGTHLRREKGFITQQDSQSAHPDTQQVAQSRLKRSGLTGFANDDVLITNWNGEWK